ncbi:hypothetical protein M0R72_01020 [Candidatus Pacearchaeota archaeon]|jgi:hypothetical protein|nr:hypothetical protein [Candidatus Pacearchaeota archaeon]
MNKTLALIKASQLREEAELALSAIDWKALPLLFKQLGSQLAAVRGLCSEIVGRTGAWLALTDTVDRVMS